jgi:hypothetical protein
LRKNASGGGSDNQESRSAPKLATAKISHPAIKGGALMILPNVKDEPRPSLARLVRHHD